MDLSPQQALSLSLALHELATNTTKYGALSTSEGRVVVEWHVSDGRLNLTWQESGGPPVCAPSRKGFGSQLLERLLGRDPSAEIALTSDPAGLRFAMSAAL